MRIAIGIPNTVPGTSGPWEEYLRSYYAFAGERAANAARTPQRIRDIVGEFEGIGTNEIVFTPTAARVEEVDRLADLVF